MTRALVTGPPSPQNAPPVAGGEPGFWVDLPALRTAYHDLGFTEHHHLDPDRASRVVLMTGTWKGQEIDVLVPLTDDYAGWGQQARTAIAILERMTGRPRVDLGALTAREAALWEVIRATRTVVASVGCRWHHVDEDGHISHRDPRTGDTDLFEHGRCEMRDRVSARLEHVLAGGE